MCLEPSYSSKTPNSGLHVCGRSYSRSSISYSTATFSRCTLGKVLEEGGSSRRHKPLSQPPVRGRLLPSDKRLLSKVFSFLKLWEKVLFTTNALPCRTSAYCVCVQHKPRVYLRLHRHVCEKGVKNSYTEEYLLYRKGGRTVQQHKSQSFCHVVGFSVSTIR